MTKKKSKSVVVAQKPPRKNSNKAVWDLVMADIKERDQNGLEKYGVRLQAFNGRDSVVDAYQEVLDLTVYFRQAIEERKALIAFVKRVRKLDPNGFPDAEKLLKKLGELE